VLNCAKIGGICPHPVKVNPGFIFVIMPFKDSSSVYDTIKQSIIQIAKPKFKIERADEMYTNLSIWCTRICKNIRKAQYCIVDTTGKNANVFYELGFAHALSNAKTIILTQNIEDAPFDIREIGHIVYSEKELPKLRLEIRNALIALSTQKKKTSKNNVYSKNEKLSAKNLSSLVEELKPLILDEIFKDKSINQFINNIKTG
jgi:hypothetical protein